MSKPEDSILEKLDIIHSEIKNVYLSNQYPWVIGYSGGKDSTATLQLIWYALAQLPPENRQKPVYVIASDTLVESPSIVEKLDATLERLEQEAKAQGMPFSADKVTPEISETFWVNLIGKGYPAPSKRFRWCTERMKINPANRFILRRAAEHGEVVMVLGARKDESMTRAQVLENESRKIPGTPLTRHSELSRAYVYTPIADFTVDDVWTYLLQVPSPWGDENRDLVALYRSAQSGECPLVIDTSTPSCGNSRFGCWVCTVVERDRSMEAMVDGGEEWMEPLLDYRNKLAETQKPSRKRKFRSFKRRNGRTIYKDGSLIPGPYTPDYRKQLLRDLLEIQRQIHEDEPERNVELIAIEELHEIRRIWREDFSDWEDSVTNIYREVMGVNLNRDQDSLGAFSAEDYELLSEVSDIYNIPVSMVAKLLDVEREKQGMGRRAGIFMSIHQILNEEWRDEETILENYENELVEQENLRLDS